MRRKTRVAVVCSAALALAVLWTPVTLATITDDIDPQGRRVTINLSNPDPIGYRGYLVVSVDLGGTTATSRTAFTISPGGSLTITSTFKSRVVQVLSTSIIENPDPIPT